MAAEYKGFVIEHNGEINILKGTCNYMLVKIQEDGFHHEKS